MAELEFFSNNRYIAYPFQYRDVVPLSPSGSLSTEWIVDAGFTLGLDSAFVAGDDSVYLHSFLIGATKVSFDFRSTASGAAGYRWLFTLLLSAPFGTSVYAEATNIATGDPSYGIGTGFIVVGKLGKIGTTVLGPGFYTLLAPYWLLEPALLQYLGTTFVRGLTIANAARLCPAECTAGSSSSSSEPGAADAYVYTSPLVGDIKFKEGNNAQIQVLKSNNTIQISAALGGGLGPSCEDVIVNGDGEGGFQRGNDCTNCDNFIKMLGGFLSVNGIMNLQGGPGVAVINYPDEHRIVVTFSSDLTCGSSSNDG